MRVTNMANRLLLLGILLISSLATKADVQYLISLQGQEFEMGNLLEWSTLQEINSSFFYIEKSDNGIDFEQIGKVDAAGNTDEASAYHFLDIGADQQKSFYRLKEIEKDGSYSYSHTVVIQKQYTNNFSIVNLNTTEINDILKVTFLNKNEGNMRIDVLNEEGEIVSQLDKSLSSGMQEVVLDMAEYKNGVYRIALTMGVEREFIVLKKISKFSETFAQKNE